jgi:hypothetical protein
MLSYAQVGPDIRDNVDLEQDSLTANDSIIIKNGFFSIFKGKPGRAALYSLVIPGGGQLYNKAYFKFPLALAIDGGCTYWLIYNRVNYRKYQNLYVEGLQTDPMPANIADLREQRNSFRKRSEYAVLILLVGHMLPVIDAYVDRQMKTFDISTDLSFNNGVQSHYVHVPSSLQLTVSLPLSLGKRR